MLFNIASFLLAISSHTSTDVTTEPCKETIWSIFTQDRPDQGYLNVSLHFVYNC